MKLIVDFDDVLFDTIRLKEIFFSVLERHGATHARERYIFERKNEGTFSLRHFIARVCKEESMDIDASFLYEEVMSACSELRNEEFIAVLKETGKENCYIVTSGEDEFQMDKIEKTGLTEYVQRIIVVEGSKKEEVEKLCATFSDEEVLFIDDKNIFFTDIEMEKCPNLKTILFNEHGMENLKAEISESKRIEQNKVQSSDEPKMR